VGAGANIGAGTITCNYDGFGKHRTEIGAEVFIGSNTALVAPVTVGEGANVAAGSTITADVAPGALALARARQVEKPGYAARLRALFAKRKASVSGALVTKIASPSRIWNDRATKKFSGCDRSSR
jgi:bifunctional UDP-N-acetylglucosamine pyrophosphorylase/glucosamine-1-phosphate N-acetyltransferase